MSRTLRRLAVVALAGALLAGCGGVQSRAGAAALVGDERITTDTLEETVERGLSDPQAAQSFGSDRIGYQTQILSRMVRGEVLEEAARDLGITVTPGDVDAQLETFATQVGGREELEQQAAAGGIDPADLPRFARVVVLEQKIGDELTEDIDVPQEELQRLYQSNITEFDRVRTRHILVEDEALARDLLAQVQADPSRFAELAAEHSLDESNAQDGGELGLHGAGTFVPEFELAVFAAQPGTFVLAQTDFGWHVIEVQERQTVSFAEAAPELRRAALEDVREERVNELLRETADELGVTVNPRFGQWDAQAVAVVERAEDAGPSRPEPADGGEEDGGEVLPGDAPTG